MRGSQGLWSVARRARESLGVELDLIDFAAGGVGRAVDGVAGDEEFAAGEGAARVDRAGVVFEEGTGEILREVVAIELGELVCGEIVAVGEFVEEAGAVEGGEIFFEAGADACGEIGGEILQEMSEGVGFGGGDGDHLAAAGVAAFGTGDGGAVFGGALLGDADDGVGELLEDGEEEVCGGFVFLPELGAGRSTAPSISAPSTWNLIWTRAGLFMGSIVKIVRIVSGDCSGAGRGDDRNGECRGIVFAYSQGGTSGL